MDFKRFLTEQFPEFSSITESRRMDSPDDIYEHGSYTFGWYGRTLAYFDKKSSHYPTHYNLLVFMKRYILEQDTWDVPEYEHGSFKAHAKYFKIVGPIEDGLKLYFEDQGRSFRSRDNFINELDGGILGRILTGKVKIMAFWNNPNEFLGIDKQHILELFKIYGESPEEYQFTFTRGEHSSSLSYDRFFKNYKPVESAPKEKSNTSHVLHTLPPEIKGQVMKSMGIKPKAPLGAAQRFAMGESLNFKMFLEAQQKFIDHIKDAVDKVDERPFKELFGNKERFLVRVYNPDFEKSVNETGLEIDQFDFKNRTYGPTKLDTNTFIKKYIKFQENKISKIDFEERKQQLVDERFRRMRRWFDIAVENIYEKQGRFEKWGGWAWMLKSETRSDMVMISIKDAKKLTHEIKEGEVISTAQIRELITKIVSGDIKTHITSWDFGRYAKDGEEIEQQIKSIRDMYMAPIRSINKIKQAIDQNNIYYYLVFSRHPVDVLRMSDHKDISSCHRLGGGKYSPDDGIYHHCAISDAQNDGGVVYLIRGKFAKTIHDKLNDPDIFEDLDRKVGSVRPLGRLRMRRFIDLNTGKDFAVPTMLSDEEKYGLFTREIYNVTLEYLRKHQSIYNNPPEPEYMEEHIIMVGGQYSDDNLNDLMNNFFGKKIYRSQHVKHKSKNVIGWAEEIEQIKETNRYRYEYITFDMRVIGVDTARLVRTEYDFKKEITDEEVVKRINDFGVHQTGQFLCKSLLSNTFTVYAEFKNNILTMSGFRVDDDPDTARQCLHYLDTLDQYMKRDKLLIIK